MTFHRIEEHLLRGFDRRRNRVHQADSTPRFRVDGLAHTLVDFQLELVAVESFVPLPIAAITGAIRDNSSRTWFT